MAVVIRLLLLPSTKKQMEMTQKMAKLKPELDKLQKKFKNNKEKLAAEQMKLYKDVGYNPIGCVSSFLPQILILAAIFGVIRTINDGNFEGLYGPVHDLVFANGKEVLKNLKFLWWDLNGSYTAFENMSLWANERLPYLFLGLAVGVVQYISTVFMQKFQGTALPKKENKGNKDEAMSPEEMQQQMTRSMSTIFPILTAYLTLSQPAVLGIYWFAQSLMFIVQYYFIDKEKFIKTLKDVLSFIPKLNESKTA